MLGNLTLIAIIGLSNMALIANENFSDMEGAENYPNPISKSHLSEPSSSKNSNQKQQSCCDPQCRWNFNPCHPKGCKGMDKGSFFISGEFLYWRAENQGFSYGTHFKSVNGLGNQGHLMRVPSEWAPAFRAGIGWNTAGDFWDIFFDYTWYRNHASRSTTTDRSLLPLWPVTHPTALFASASAKTHFKMDMGDLEIGRLLFLTKSLACRPYIGIRGGILHQKLENSFSNSIVLYEEQNFSGKNDFWGVGPRTGFKGEWHWTERFSLTGNLAGALLYGKTKASSVTNRRDVGSSTALQFRHTDYFYQLAPTLQMAFGFQWQTCFNCERMFFKMGASWETNYWWNQLNCPLGHESTLIPFPATANQSLNMEGLTVNMEWDF